MSNHPHVKLKQEVVAVPVITTVPLSPVLPVLTVQAKVKAKAKSILQMLLGRTRIGKPIVELKKVTVSRDSSRKRWLVKHRSGITEIHDHVILKDCEFETKEQYAGCGSYNHTGVACGLLVSTAKPDSIPEVAAPVKFSGDAEHFILPESGDVRVDTCKYLVLNGKDTRVIQPK